MSTPIIVTGGGGHRAMHAISDHFANLSHSEQLIALSKVTDLIDFVNAAKIVEHIDRDQP